jgi:hypothetical protein
MVLVRQRTQLKNRIYAPLAKYALHDLEVSDLFGVRGRGLLRQRLTLLPPVVSEYSTEPTRMRTGASAIRLAHKRGAGSGSPTTSADASRRGPPTRSVGPDWR